MPDRIGELIDQARTLDGSVTRLQETVNEQRVSQRRMKWVIATLAAVIVALVGGGVWLAEVASTATQNTETQRLTCESGNQARAAQRQLWGYLFELSAQQNPDQTAEQKAQVAKFKAYVDTVFADRDCTRPAVVTPIPTPSR